MVNFKQQMMEIIHSSPNAFDVIEKIQLEKRESGEEREWGDTLLDEIVEDRRRSGKPYV